MISACNGKHGCGCGPVSSFGQALLEHEFKKLSDKKDKISTVENSLEAIDILEWCYHTLKEQLKFGLPEAQAVIARERRVRGVLNDVINYLKNVEDKKNSTDKWSDKFIASWPLSLDGDAVQVVPVGTKEEVIRLENMVIELKLQLEKYEKPSSISK